MEPRKIDRSKWGHGPWDDEPDRVDFESHGFPCLVLRTEMGHLCGYVAVPPGHPWYGQEDVHASVHGGITYGEKSAGAICHVPKPGQPDDVWWLGFDCAHCDDISPSRPDHVLPWRMPYGVYRDVQYVQRQCESLARQAAEALRLAGVTA